jgi:hypothetical protein
MVITVGVLWGVSSSAAAAPVPPPEPAPVDGPPSLLPVPPGCTPPEIADVAFVGTVLDKDGLIEKGTVRFQIDQLKAGDSRPFAVGGMIDVRFGPDSKYLDVGAGYLVSASVDPSIGVLSSKVTPDAPLFGGDAVVGLEDTAVDCPTFEDPVQTLNVDGSTVDSGLLSPMLEDRRLLLATIGVPAAIAGAVLIALVLLRRMLDIGFRGIFALGRTAVTPSTDVAAARVRQHRTSEEDADSLLDDVEDGGGEADTDPKSTLQLVASVWTKR